MFFHYTRPNLISHLISRLIYSSIPNCRQTWRKPTHEEIDKLNFSEVIFSKTDNRCRLIKCRWLLPDKGRLGGVAFGVGLSRDYEETELEELSG